MSNRVFDRLAAWATMPDDELKTRIADIEGKEPDIFKLAEARRLFAKALETPGGLKIQTIHAFARPCCINSRSRPMSPAISPFSTIAPLKCCSTMPAARC